MPTLPTVAIITRTKDRPLLLRRALRSVLAQTYADWQLVVVNDGGNSALVDTVIADVEGQLQGRAIVIHNAESIGMEAASNIGIKSSKSEFVVILDDDDTWEPAFLERTVAYLQAPSYLLSTPLGAVVTHSVMVEETIEGDRISICRREPFNPGLKGVSLGLLAARNMLPTNSLVFRRSVLDDIGWFREDLPVLGDWDFNLRLAERYEIGVIPECLANFHKRRNRDSYGNSVVAGNDLHLVFDVLLRNEYLRRDLKAGRIGLGFLMDASRNHQDTHRKLTTRHSVLPQLARWLADRGRGRQT